MPISAFLPLIACLSWSSREKFCAQIIVGIRQRSRMNERILIFSLIGLYLGLKSHKDINTNFISKSLPVNSNPILRIIYFCR